MAGDLNEMIQGFVEESHESFDEIENDLLTIESNPDDLTIVNSVFRVLHTIKGTAGFLKLDEISKLSHKIESIFDLIRREELKISSELMDTLLPSIDLLKLMVFELTEENRSEYDLDVTLETLQAISNIPQTPWASSDPVLQKVGPTEAARSKAEDGDLELLEEFRKQSRAISSDLKTDFVMEAEEHLGVIEENLLNLEQRPDDEDSINEVFRAIHSIKGTSDYVDLKAITRLSHKLETIFDRIRKGNRKYDDDLADVVLKGVDVLQTLLTTLKTGDLNSIVQFGETVHQLDKYTPMIDEDSEEPAGAEGPDQERNEPRETDRNVSDIMAAFRNISSQQLMVIEHLGASFIENGLDSDELMVLLRSIKTLKNSAKNIGVETLVNLTTRMEKIVFAVLSQEKKPGDIRTDFLAIDTALTDEIKKLSDYADEAFAQLIDVSSRKEIVPDVPEEAEAPTPDKTALSDGKEGLSTTKEETSKSMRIDSSRLDTFMNLIGELIIVKNSYSHTLNELSEIGIPSRVQQDLKIVESAFNRISNNMQATLMDIRLIPIKTIFQKIPRIVRDIARKTGKKIQLQMIGEETEIDKSIIEMLGDPLVHIVRNCCDHGIETIRERFEAGKPETGTIILKANHLGNAIAIDIIDDGAGIDTSHVLQLAIDRGMVTPEQADTLDSKTINNFVFQPGFSTVDKVTDISGRGVGMDVVITNIKKINGTADIESDEGHGTRVRLLLPLTLAVIDSLLVIEGQRKYAIPLEAVKETVEIKEGELQTLKRKEAINLRGDIVGVSRLADLLELEKKEPDPDRDLSIVLLQAGPRKIGVVVDDLFNQQEIVVKPLQRYLSNIPGINASTILGNGEIVLILDPSELIDLAAL
ncbi:MAG: chemotaxis protein CheA [Proteobacteria bacterium]|nr:chemotaxis protein CheA [Pseudomonadota bacterium]